MQLRLDFPNIQTYHSEEEVALLADAIRGAKTLTMGPRLKGFEESFTSYLGVKHAFGVSNATAALELGAILSGVSEGDEVILPAHTFTASALPFLRRKARLIFVDIDPDTFLMDMNHVRKKITARTRVLVPVHLYGLPVAMDQVMELAQRHNLWVVEDCAQALGASFKGRKVGTFGHVGCFSFHSQKNLTTLGEGGMIVTNDDDLAEKILGLRKIGQRPYRNQEKYWKPAMSNVAEVIRGELPYNFALGEIQAYAGDLLLRRLDNINAVRERQYHFIVRSLKDLPELVFQKIPDDRQSAFHLVPARYNGIPYRKNRDDLIDLLYRDYGIKCVVQYCPLYRYNLFQENGYAQADCPQTDLFFDNMISFPFASDMPQQDLEALVSAARDALMRLRK